jgi:zinc/manganese transport system ATP-binding protein
MTDDVLRITAAELRLGGRVLWSGLDLQVRRGEFIAVLGANGSGKTSLLRAILGQHELATGEIRLLGEPVARGDRRIGYIPQQRLADEGMALRGRDLVGLGIDGHRFGIGLPSRTRRARVDAALDAVGARHFARIPVARLSGGEQQRLRVGQALAGMPDLLLCDEPLLSLDLRQQRVVSDLIDSSRRERDFGVLFVTHDVNPILGAVDRVLYLAGGGFRIGTPDEVLRSDVLSELYGSPIDVIRSGDRVVIVGGPDQSHAHEHDHDHARDLP